MKYSITLAALAATASAQGFTSVFNITATPDQVINSMNVPAPGQPGARGQFNFAINSRTETICYEITLTGVTGDYQSPANTATHIHEGVKGRAGPPRIAFPNPGPLTNGTRRSTGCLTGPFTTGVKGPDNTTDTGAGFRLAQIEANPAGFFTDSHTQLFLPGVVRGQLDQSFELIDPVGEVITTATVTATDVITITKCPVTVTDCPANGPFPIVTAIESVYTTVCPVSDLPYYTKPAQYGSYVSGHPIPTNGGFPAETHPAYPGETHPADSGAGAGGDSNGPYGTGPAAPSSTTLEYTGAASAIKAGGALFAAGLVVAFL